MDRPEWPVPGNVKSLATHAGSFSISSLERISVPLLQMPPAVRDYAGNRQLKINFKTRTLIFLTLFIRADWGLNLKAQLSYR